MHSGGREAQGPRHDHKESYTDPLCQGNLHSQGCMDGTILYNDVPIICDSLVCTLVSKMYPLVLMRSLVDN